MIGFPQLGQTGRLGNQLWQIASTIGIAYALGEEPWFPTWDYQPYFSLPEEFFILKGSVRPADQTPNVQHIPEAARIYLQDYGLWRDVATDVKKWLQPSAKALDKLLTYQEFWTLEPPVLSLHVRRGDNVTEGEWKKKYHPPRPMSYYDAALDEFEYESLAVFSDDPDWCETKFRDLADYVHHGTPRPKEHEPEFATSPFSDWIDLQLMTFSDYHIISNSTYAWWGAFLSDDSSPVYPWPWYGSKLSYIDASLMFPPEWTRITHHAV